MENSGRSLLQLLNDLLDVSKVESGNLRISKSPQYINSFLKEIMKFFQDKMTEKGLNFKLIIERELDRGSSIIGKLQSFGFSNITCLNDYNKAKEFLTHYNVNLVILDYYLDSGKMGLDFYILT